MSDTSTVQTREGIGFFGLLTLVFVIAKIGGWINWSWWLVFLPVWGLLALFVVITAVIFLGYVVAEIFKSRRAAKARRERLKR